MSKEMLEMILPWLSEVIFMLCGLVSVNCAFRGLQNESKRIGTFIFWFVLGLIFMFGKWIPANMIGGMLLVLGCLTATKQVTMGKFENVSQEFKDEQAFRHGNAIFIPAVLIGLVALLLSQFKIMGVSIPSAVSIGMASLVALAVAWVIVKPKVSETRDDSSRLLMQVGAASLLPQLLGALGTLFTEAGVGAVISSGISAIIPSGNILLGVIVYCAGMMIFTMIMGNGFAAFSVITVGIGVPFVIMQGGNPAVVGALGLTAGYCGTLITPMAANFNIVPSAVLETKDKYEIIKAQLPMSLIMIVIHVILMLVLAF